MTGATTPPPPAARHGSSHPRPGVPIGYVGLTVQGNIMTSNRLPPRVSINGRPMNTSYGHHSIPVPAGPVHIEADMRWGRRYGQASLHFQLAPGQTVPVYYAAPLHQFSRGAMGHEPQKRRGAAGFLVTAGVLTAILLGGYALTLLLFTR